MKYYIINSEGKEVSFDLTVDTDSSKSKKVQIKDGLEVKKDYQVRKLAGKSYISTDGNSWKKLARLSSSTGLVNVNEAVKVYRGFKPSGLSNANAGDLITEMPGKIVKIMTTEGAVVQAGDTLIILEAMKMENEIKAGVNGVIKAVHVKQGDVLDSGHLMIEIEE